MFRLIILTGMLAVSAIAATLLTGTEGESMPSFVRSEPTPPRRVAPGNTVRRTVNTNTASNLEPFIGGTDDGSSIRRKQPNQNSFQRPVNTKTAANLRPFIGGSDDGQSIRRKQPRKRSTRKPNE